MLISRLPLQTRNSSLIINSNRYYSNLYTNNLYTNSSSNNNSNL